MKKVFLLLTALSLLLVGCAYRTTTEERTGTVSGCEIYKIQLQGEHYPLFLAKCKTTATVTYNTGGKSNVRRTTVTTIEEEQAELTKKKEALAKLSDEEKRLLGLQ